MCGDGLGHNAFKESVNSRALDPEHELSEVNDTFINILEKNSDHNNNDFKEGITHPSSKNSSRVGMPYRSRTTWRRAFFANISLFQRSFYQWNSRQGCLSSG